MRFDGLEENPIDPCSTRNELDGWVEKAAQQDHGGSKREVPQRMHYAQTREAREAKVDDQRVGEGPAIGSGGGRFERRLTVARKHGVVTRGSKRAAQRGAKDRVRIGDEDSLARHASRIRRVHPFRTGGRKRRGSAVSERGLSHGRPTEQDAFRRNPTSFLQWLVQDVPMFGGRHARYA